MTPEPVAAAGVRWRSVATAAKSRPLRGATIKKSWRKPALTTRSYNRPEHSPRPGQAQLFRAFDVLRRLPFSPRIVGVRKHQALGQRRMRVEPKPNERRRIRIGQIIFAHRLKRMRSDLSGAWHDSVNQFEPEDVRTVFFEPAIAVHDGRRQKSHAVNQEQ